MSIKLYTFAASSDDNLHEQIGIMKFLSIDLAYAKENGIDIQVFRTSKGIRYRVLEVGYSLQNKMWDNPAFFPTCNYDDRADISEKDLPNKAMAEEVDHLIATKQWSIFTILQDTQQQEPMSEEVI
jgi:hypothetical protein